MKRKLLSLIMLLSLIAVPASAAAATLNPFAEICAGASKTQSGDNPSSVCTNLDDDGDPFTGKNGILLRVVSFISIITGMASIVVIIIGGIKYSISTGDSTAVNSAKNTILYAIVGLAVSLLGQAIIRFVGGWLS